MRAFYHMQLLLNWEKIINRDIYITSSGELDKAMSERPDSWNFIVDDLQKAGADLPQKRPADNLGRATSGSAYASSALPTSPWLQSSQRRKPSI